MGITFGSLFAGIGGFDLGFERAGMVCKWQVEIDDYATKVLQKHWPQVHRERDIRQCGKHNLESVDVICGGFPCQDISYAGLGAGLEGERSGLFFEAIRVVRELRPRIVVLENVAALLTRGLDRVLGTLAEIGFDAEWHCIPAAAVGAPHIRDRVFVLAYRNGEPIGTVHAEVADLSGVFLSDPFGKGTGNLTRADCRQERQQADASESKTVRQAYGSSGSGRVKSVCENVWAIGSPDIGTRRIWASDWWETEPAVGRVADGIPNRVDRLRGLGNAVVPQVAEWIGRKLLKALEVGENA